MVSFEANLRGIESHMVYSRNFVSQMAGTEYFLTSLRSEVRMRIGSLIIKTTVFYSTNCPITRKEILFAIGEVRRRKNSTKHKVVVITIATKL